MKNVIALLFISAFAWCAEAAEYSPQGHEQFVFSEISKENQEYGYGQFCPEAKPHRNPLNYKKYFGIKGYFISDKPVHKDEVGAYWPVILETGEEYFFLEGLDGNRYSPSSPIFLLEKHPSAGLLYQGSEVFVLSRMAGWDGEKYTLSNGHTVAQNTLASIGKIVEYFPTNKPRIAELLLKFDISEDVVENRFVIRSNANKSVWQNQAMLYVVVDSKKQWLRMKIQYTGDDWLFVSSYKIAADDYRWQSEKMHFERDHSNRVWEWVDKAPSIQDLKNLKALSKAKNPVIRFQGRQYFSDFQLEPIQQEAIIDVMELFDLMNRTKRKG